MAIDFIEELEALVDAFNAADVEYALCGGVAVNIHGHVRSTDDLDVLVDEDDVDPVLEIARRHGFVIPSGRLPFAANTPQERFVHRDAKVDGEAGSLSTSCQSRLSWKRPGRTGQSLPGVGARSPSSGAVGWSR